MSRIHLFEFEDQKWFPTLLRNFGTDFLQFLCNKAKIYQPILPVLERALVNNNHKQIIDLCSGGGGGLIWLNSELKKNVPELRILLTDYFPNIASFNYTKNISDNFEFITRPVDARKVPPELSGLRTLFLSLHHFKPKDALQILQNAVDSSNPIAAFEAQERSLASILAMLFSPITLLLSTPFIKPFKPARLLFTYLIPVVPLFVLWDGVVSCFRTYSVKEMNLLIEQVKNDNFNWEVNRVKSGPGVILYLIGEPKNYEHGKG